MFAQPNRGFYLIAPIGLAGEHVNLKGFTMAKGFGIKPDRQLGYVLNLRPKFHAYAGKFSLDFRGESGRFIGVVSDVKDAQV
ncbi:MAG: hypothetical protein EA368_08890 [Leptolyngbya sp. DLM2.Bin27]|nr:MAG: hypothetical protein EA368_08890 [Leptolyngbya sp. DLM2.Bin27]